MLAAWEHTQEKTDSGVQTEGPKDAGNSEGWWELKTGQIRIRRGLTGLDDENTLNEQRSQSKGEGLWPKWGLSNLSLQDSRVQGEYGNRHLIRLHTCLCPSQPMIHTAHFWGGSLVLSPTCRLNSAKSQLQRLHYHRPILTHFYPLPPHFLTLAQSYTNSGSCHTVSLYKFVFPIRCWVPWELEPRINHLLIHISTIFLINKQKYQLWYLFEDLFGENSLGNLPITAKPYLVKTRWIT